MSTRGASKKDALRQVQMVRIGASVSSAVLDTDNTEDSVEIAFPAEKISVVTTGTLVATVTPKIGAANANAAIPATTTPSAVVTTSTLFSSVSISRTSGEGTVLILAK